MSFWDDVTGLFTGDTYFPDNPKREHRAHELAFDCQELAGKLTLLAPQIKSDLQQLNSELAAIYGNADQVPADVKQKELSFDDWELNVAQLVIPLLTAPLVSSALTTAATTYLVSTGEIGAAALAELVGLPVVFEIGIGAIAGAAAIVVSFGIGAFSGAYKRDKLRDAIHDAVKARQEFEKSYLVNYRLSISIQAMIKVIHALKDSNAETSLILEKLKEMVSNAKEEINTLTNEQIESVLAGLDMGRGSWVGEDK